MTCKNTFLFDIVEIIRFLFDSRFCVRFEIKRRTASGCYVIIIAVLGKDSLTTFYLKRKPDPEFFFPGHAQIKFKLQRTVLTLEVSLWMFEYLLQFRLYSMLQFYHKPRQYALNHGLKPTQ